LRDGAEAGPVRSRHVIQAVEYPKGRFLIVDDEEHIREILAATLAPLALSVHTAGSAEDALDLVRDENIDMVICDVQMPGMDGLEFLRKVKGEQPSVKFLMITAHGTMDTAVRALRFGASDFLTKPFENEEIRNIARRLLRERSALGEVDGLGARAALVDPSEAAGAQGPFAGVVGRSPAFAACLEKARKAAGADTTVLLCGESGTGKEVLARAIHVLSRRSEKPFIAVNCGAIPENLLESELFGHEKGAFTGAIASKPGKFVLAHGGTIFLDEIGEMPLLMQVKLLRVIQERTVEPVGSARSQKVDFRLLAATNRNLKEEIKVGRFREDLYYRLNIIPLDLPPLREREGDVLLLAKSFLVYFNERYGCSFGLTPENERELLSHPWPGNVRELANAIERAVVLASGPSLAFAFERDEAPAAAAESGMEAGAKAALKERKQAVERETILKVLEQNRWNKTQTAEALGISRRSLLYKIKEYGIA
ncbi:MAG TPA: sigma-54 dependent transcriptional regulator, partial [Fibrobacteria bacterium]|nr:sigma-54 dependent transcriptional regulator [Fibrobacteria bacterium]